MKQINNLLWRPVSASAHRPSSLNLSVEVRKRQANRASTQINSRHVAVRTIERQHVRTSSAAGTPRSKSVHELLSLQIINAAGNSGGAQPRHPHQVSSGTWIICPQESKQFPHIHLLNHRGP